MLELSIRSTRTIYTSELAIHELTKLTELFDRPTSGSLTLTFSKGPDPYTISPGYKTRSVRLCFDHVGGDSIWSGTDVSSDSILLLLLSLAIGPTSFLPIPDCDELTSLLPEIWADVVLFSNISSSNRE